MSVELGSVGEWVGGLAAAGGLVFAGWEIRTSSLRRREDLETERASRAQDEELHREAMARSVSVQAIPSQRRDDSWFADYEIHNGGDYPIATAVLVVGDPWAEDYRPLEQVGTAAELVVGTVAAGRTLTGTLDHLHFRAAPAFGELTALASLLFTDVWGQFWAVSAAGIEKRDGPPRIC